jgi:hypothetical protein
MKTTDKYVLIGQTAVPCDDWLEWGMTFEHQDRRVGLWRRGPVLVSTVFLGLDHNWGDGPPLLFETMIFFLGTSVDYEERCATWTEAEAMHGKAIGYVCSMWRHPRELAGWIREGILYWTRTWDRRFAARYKKFPYMSED